MFSIAATASPPNAVANVLYVEPLVAKDGGPFTSVMLGFSAEAMTDGTANASTSVAIPLEVGIQYQFGGGFGSNNPVFLSVGTCQGTVQILRPQL